MARAWMAGHETSFRLVVHKSFKPVYASRKFPVSFECTVDFKIHISQSIASLSKFKLFLGLDGALIAAFHKKTEGVCAHGSNYSGQPT